MDQQHEVVNILEAIDRKADLYRRKLAALEQLLKVLLHQIMSGKAWIDDLGGAGLVRSSTTAQVNGRPIGDQS